MTNKEKVIKHKMQSIHYYENALKSIEAGEAEKAGEFVWGSMAQALKAVAAIKDTTLRSHSQIVAYAESIAKQLENKSIYDAFIHARSLHSNFYECELEMKEIIRAAGEVREAVKTLLNLASKGIADVQGG